MTRPDLHEDLNELARRLPAPPPRSLDTLAGRVRQRRRRRAVGLVAAVVVVLAGVVGVGSQWLPQPRDPVAPEVVDAFGPVFAEIHACPAGLLDCPDVPVDQAVEQIVSFVDDRPAVTVTDTRVEDGPDRELPPEGAVVVRIHRTAGVDRLLRDLVALPVVDGVTLGSADKTPAALREAGPLDGPMRGQTLGRLTVPVHDRDTPQVHEIWELTPGSICYGPRPGSVCTSLTVRGGEVSGGNTSPYEESPGCRSVVTGPDVDHVRMTARDGTRLEVVSTPLHPELTVLTLHVACWTDSTSGVTYELLAPDGTIIDESP